MLKRPKSKRKECLNSYRNVAGNVVGGRHNQEEMPKNEENVVYIRVREVSYGE